MDHADRLAFGKGGCHNVIGTEAVTGSFYAIQVLEDATFSVLTDLTADATSADISGVVIKAGIVLFGDFTAFTLSGGTVRAYRQLR